MSEQVTTGQGFIELETAPYLEEGQNFYDQQPFSAILQGTAEKLGVDVTCVRRFLTLITFSPITYRSFNEGDLTPELNRLLQTYSANTVIDDRLKTSGFEGRITGNQRMMVMELGRQLSEYPLWADYIRTQLESEYHTDGRYFARAKTIMPRESYVFWAKRAIELEKRARLWEIEEVFPQDFAGESSALPDIAPSKPLTRLWRMRKIAETVREKRD